MNELRDKDRRAARSWLGEAGDELGTARLIAREQPDYLRPACFHAHLAAEKALKAALVASGAPFVKEHDLLRLLERVRETVFSVDVDAAIDAGDLQTLSGWELEGRYPADLPEPASSDVEALLEASERVVVGIGSVLAPVFADLDG